MKRRNLFALLVVAFLVTVISACNFTPKDDQIVIDDSHGSQAVSLKDDAVATADDDTGVATAEPQSSSTDGGQASVDEDDPDVSAKTNVTAKSLVEDQIKPSLMPFPTTATPIKKYKPSAKANSPKEQLYLKAALSIVGETSHGTILTEAVYEFAEGDTVIDLLKRVTRELKIHMEFRGRGAMAYVEGIDNLYEFDQGAQSGWIYRVNGKIQNKSAGSYALSDGDIIKWEYTLIIDEAQVDNDEGIGKSNEEDGKLGSKGSTGGSSE